jgi:nucleotide-binding universal stress UspA family protein
VTALVVVLGALVVVLAAALVVRRRPPRRLPTSGGGRRILVPFTGTSLDSTVLQAAIRIARAEDAVLVPAYLLIVPLEYPEDSPLQKEVAVAVPLLDAVEQAALRAGVPVDARIEKGRTATHALRRLWEAESFDRIVVPARAGVHPGFDPKELAWVLTHAPAETLVLRPTPTEEELRPERRLRPRRRERELVAASR